MIQRLMMVILLSLPLQGFTKTANLIDKRWLNHDPDSTLRIDHSLWQSVLDRFLHADASGQTYFDYPSAKKDKTKTLKRYIDQLSDVNPDTLNRDEQLAYWINLYNALTVALVLEAYPVDSIKHVKGGLFNLGPWTKRIVTVNDQRLSLDNIEHGIIRPIWKDDRIHYGVNCAAWSCPNLAPDAYTHDNIHQQLNHQRNIFINHPRGVRYENGRITVSSIFRWFQQDFADSENALKDYLMEYAKPTLQEQLRTYDGRLHYEYDWSLNLYTPSP